jgi:hypothetical protein
MKIVDKDFLKQFAEAIKKYNELPPWAKKEKMNVF